MIKPSLTVSRRTITSLNDKNGNGILENFAPRPDVVYWCSLGKILASKPYRLFGQYFTNRTPIPQHQVLVKKLQAYHCLILISHYLKRGHNCVFKEKNKKC